MKQRITEILRNYEKRHIAAGHLTPSAVLVSLFSKDGQCHVLLTERSCEVNSHKGQVCFPGGTHQEGDSSLLQTALRECEEEIGLKAEDAEILGELDDNIVSSTGYVISPFVASIPYPYPFKANRREIRQIFSVPLSFLMNKANLKQGRQVVDDQSFAGYAYEYESHIIWGATARILKHFTDLLEPESGALG
ncbi:MAG: CoA pyrophosphatase [Chloroflexota bacterium]|nr:CoA pyrophosphatase [Chloroflexota bacterium]